ncbi:hypothetical protein [Sinorhizobium meliloti]|uniref:hypothetical protein n=1 Tax=Rhizobium meliloti TaxID=382 RepID=UPI001F1C0ACF|nr:hypothetical protein [Sinorhizobium meliloti]
MARDATSGDISSTTLKTATTTKTWDHTNSELAYSQNGKLVIASAEDDSGSIGFADPEKNVFAYQTYGGWVDEKGGRLGPSASAAKRPRRMFPPVQPRRSKERRAASTSTRSAMTS